ncbi:MAG: 16S rRNA (cytosine(1402)-N(4))-methyltransferase [Bacteroidetes bacterium]|nr:MAG: 16S rRNA (cytosine(1402)-N(4))-methyltransferase [Bacteroidota bacterium]
MTEYHLPVMLQECLEALKIKPEGTYVDLTFGGGGHSAAILERLTTGKLFVFDMDPDANANAVALNDKRLEFIPSNFRYFSKYLRMYNIKHVDGVLADLGVSSHQIDAPERGFSTRFEANLDMRMDQQGKLSAADILNDYAEEKLVQIFSNYAEIRNSRTLAREVVAARNSTPINTSEQLKKIILPLAKRGKENQYMARVYQALRIEVNDEMAALREMLEQTADVLNPGGRLVVMSYHSLEDRLVKYYINTGNFKGEQEKDFFGNLIRPLEPVVRKPITASEEELSRNNRARSAKLRIAEK